MTDNELWTVETHSGKNPSISVVCEARGWRTIYGAKALRGRPAITSARIEPLPASSDPQLTGRLARDLLRPGLALAYVRLALSEDSPGFLAGHGIDGLGERRGKRAHPFIYAVVASHYVKAVKSGSHQPVKDAAKELAFRGDFVRDALVRARDRGLLTAPPTSRRAGGKLTARGRKILKDGPPPGYAGPPAA